MALDIGHRNWLTVRRSSQRTDDPEDIVKYFLEDYRSEEPKTFFNWEIFCSDVSGIFIGAT